MTALAIVTGASKGLGRAIAVEAAKSLSLCQLVLVSRSKEGMEDTKRQIHSSHPSLHASIHSIDFSDLDHLEDNVKALFKELDPSKFKQIYLFTNHGTLDPIAPLRTLSDFTRVRKDVDTNLTSVIILSALFLQHFSPSALPSPPHLFLVNTSTLAAVKVFPAWSIYCSGRAARDMLHACIAKEEDERYIKTVNYAPGPCDTDMMKAVRDTTGHAPTHEYYTNLHKEGKLVDCNDSIRKLIKVLNENKFESVLSSADSLRTSFYSSPLFPYSLGMIPTHNLQGSSMAVLNLEGERAPNQSFMLSCDAVEDLSSHTTAHTQFLEPTLCLLLELVAATNEDLRVIDCMKPAKRQDNDRETPADPVPLEIGEGEVDKEDKQTEINKAPSAAVLLDISQIFAQGPWYRETDLNKSISINIGSQQFPSLAHDPNVIQQLKEQIDVRIVDPDNERVPFERIDFDPQSYRLGLVLVCRFTPTKSGEHFVHICVNDEHIKGSPYKVRVRKSVPVLSELMTRVSEYRTVEREHSGYCGRGVNCTRSLAKEAEDGTFTLAMLACHDDQIMEGPHYHLLDTLVAEARDVCGSDESQAPVFLDMFLAKCFKHVPFAKMPDVHKDLLHYMRTEEMSLQLLITLTPGTIAIPFKSKWYLKSLNDFEDDFEECALIAVFDDNGAFVELGTGQIKDKEEWSDISDLPLAHMFTL